MMLKSTAAAALTTTAVTIPAIAAVCTAEGPAACLARATHIVDTLNTKVVVSADWQFDTERAARFIDCVRRLDWETTEIDAWMIERYCRFADRKTNGKAAVLALAERRRNSGTE
jgi:hypothetical protein